MRTFMELPLLVAPKPDTRTASLALLLFFCARGLAAPPDTETTVVVTAKRAPGSLVAPDRVRAARAIRKTPGGVDLIDGAEVRTGRATTPQDLLGFSPGLFVQQRDTGAQESRVSIRGSGLQRTFHLRGIKVLQDGIPLNQADGSGDMQRVEPLTVSYTEVFRGGNALRYGATTLGGAINLVTPTGHEASPLQWRLQRGSFGHTHAQVSTGGAKGPLDHYLSLSTFHQEGFRAHTRQKNHYLFFNGGWVPKEGWEARLYVTREQARAELGGGLTKAQVFANPRQARLFNVTGDNRRDFDYYRFASKTTYRSGVHRVDLTAYYFGIDLFHPIFQVLDVDSRDHGGEVRYTSTAPLAGMPNTLLVGFSPSIGTQREDRFVNAGGRRGARTAEFSQRAENRDLYVEDQLQLTPRLLFVPGLQASRATRRFTDRFFANGDDSGRVRYHAVNPKAGLVYELTRGLQAFAGYNRGFEPPSFSELLNLAGDFLPNRAQASDTVEGGVRGALGAANVDLTVYDSRVEDELLSLNDGQGNPLGTINARVPTTHRGIELGARAPLVRNLSVRGLYNLTRLRFRGDPVYRDNQLPGLPEHFARLELLYEHPAGFYAGPNAERVISGYPVDFANTVFADTYTIWGAKIGLRRKTGTSLWLEGKNLSDRIYVASTGIVNDALGRDANQIFNPGNGRSWFGGAEMRF
jgi:iron complex outermembrane receptor protein